MGIIESGIEAGNPPTGKVENLPDEPGLGSRQIIGATETHVSHSQPTDVDDHERRRMGVEVHGADIRVCP
jgi:hypothetical protein